MGTGVVGALFRSGPQIVGMCAPQPVVLRTGDARDEGQRVLHGVSHRTRLGARSGRPQVDAATAAVVHAGRCAVGGVVRTRADEGVLTAPLIIKSVRGEDVLHRRVVGGQRPEVAGHHRIAVEIDRTALGLGIVVRSPYVPAPDQRAAGVVGSDHGVALLDLVPVVAVGSHVERRLAVFQLQVLDQIRPALPDDIDRRGRQLGQVALVHGVDQVVGLLLVDQITVGRLAAQILGVDHTHEKRRRSRRSAVHLARQGHRTRLYGIIVVVEFLGRDDRNGAVRRVDNGIAPARGFARYRETLDVGGRKAHRHCVARIEENGRRIERDRSRFLVLAARSKKNDGRNRANQPCKSFHIVHSFLISVSKSTAKIIKSRTGAKPNCARFNKTSPPESAVTAPKIPKSGINATCPSE